MRKFMIRIIAPTTAASALLLAGHSSIAAPTKEDCEVGYKVCYRGCKGPAGDLGEPCRAQCDVDLVRCHDKVGGKETAPKVAQVPRVAPWPRTRHLPNPDLRAARPNRVRGTVRCPGPSQDLCGTALHHRPSQDLFGTARRRRPRALAEAGQS